MGQRLKARFLGLKERPLRLSITRSKLVFTYFDMTRIFEWSSPFAGNRQNFKPAYDLSQRLCPRYRTLRCRSPPHRGWGVRRARWECRFLGWREAFWDWCIIRWFSWIVKCVCFVCCARKLEFEEGGWLRSIYLAMILYMDILLLRIRGDSSLYMYWWIYRCKVFLVMALLSHCEETAVVVRALASKATGKPMSLRIYFTCVLRLARRVPLLGGVCLDIFVEICTGV